MSSAKQQNKSAPKSHFIVCGLGSLGQQCVKLLNNFNVSIIAIDKQETINWEVDGIPHSIKNNYLVGDIQESEILEQANIKECRAILIVTDDETVNIETACEIAKINPRARIIVRSSNNNFHEKSKLNHENLAFVDATELPAQVFATRSLGDENRGFFQLENEWLGIFKVKIHPNHKWRGRQLHQISNKDCRVLSHISAIQQLPTLFHEWKPNLILQSNDEVAYIEVNQKLVHWYGDSDSLSSEGKNKGFYQKLIDFIWKKKREKKVIALKEWTKYQISQPIIRMVFFTWLILFILGIAILTIGLEYHPLKALYTSAVMLLGGYDAVYLRGDNHIVLERLINFTYMLSGILLMGVLQAWLTQWVLNERFQQLFAYAKSNHTVVIGLSNLGEKIAGFLQKWQQPVFGLNDKKPKMNILPQAQLLIGDFIDNLQKTNLANAKSVIVVTDDEDDNIDIGLKAYKINPNSNLIIRTFDHHKTNEIKEYLPFAKVINDYELAAETFVGNAFGKHIRNLFRFNEQTILVAEYTIKPGDTLNGCFLFEIAYGYGVVPILYQTYKQIRKQVRPKILPNYWDKSPLEPGDRIVILGNFDSLQKIEIGDRQLPDCRLRVRKKPLQHAILRATHTIAYICGCSPEMVKELMQNLPGILDCPIYRHQGQLLLRKLKKLGVDAVLVENLGSSEQ